MHVNPWTKSQVGYVCRQTERSSAVGDCSHSTKVQMEDVFFSLFVSFLIHLACKIFIGCLDEQ